MSQIQLIITDLDNTLYNWVDFYVPSFLAMIQELHRLTGVPEEELKASFKKLHQKYTTSEYTFALQQLDVLKSHNYGLATSQILQKYNSAIYAFRRVRKETLHLYSGVDETLIELRRQGKRIVAHTEALMYHATARLKQLGVEDLYDGIFAPPDHGFPEGTRPEDVRAYNNMDAYQTKIPIAVEVDPSIRKPDPRSLLIVLERFGVRPGETVYIGDSLSRDILMAQRCGVHDVYAQYGRGYDPKHYEELVKITYWRDEDVEQERYLKTLHINPTFIVPHFAILLDVVQKIESSRGVVTSPGTGPNRTTSPCVR